jgi:hypothetical protein
MTINKKEDPETKAQATLSPKEDPSTVKTPFSPQTPKTQKTKNP